MSKRTLIISQEVKEESLKKIKYLKEFETRISIYGRIDVSSAIHFSSLFIFYRYLRGCGMGEGKKHVLSAPLAYYIIITVSIKTLLYTHHLYHGHWREAGEAAIKY